MRKLMLELLTYEPFKKLIPEEKEYIGEILSENYQQPQSMFHDLFLGFYCYVHKGDFKDVIWLRHWRDTYHQNKNYTHSTKSGRVYYPLLFKKICFYIMIRGEFTDKEFMGILGLSVNRIRKWGISPQFRKYAEANTYSVIRSYRSGTKRKYLVLLIKRLYYEAGRQVSQAMILNRLPPFVDVFAGTASVAASVVPPCSEEKPEEKPKANPIINDYDPVMVCFAWAFTFYQRELRKRIVEFHNYLRRDLKLTDCSYDITAYDRHKEEGNVFTDPEASDNPSPRTQFWWEIQKYSKEYIKERKRLAQRHQEFVIRARSSYKDVKFVLDKLSDSDRKRLRDIFSNNPPTDIVFRKCPSDRDCGKCPKRKNCSKRLKPEIYKQIDDVLDYALALFFYYSFPPKKGHIYHEINVDMGEYLSFLDSLQVDLKDVKGEDKADKDVKGEDKADKDVKGGAKADKDGKAAEADKLLKFELKANSLTLESTGEFSRHLRNAEFYCKPFKDILGFGPDKIYYLDSPYFLTTEYDVKFSDDNHKDMLDLLRKAEFKWIFSIQYKPSVEGTDTSKKRCRSKPPIIRNYGDYYRGFYLPLTLDTDQRAYMPKDDPNDPKPAPSNLFAILFDVDVAEAKELEVYRETREMLVVNFNCLPAIPLHGAAVVLPFDLFLQCADAGMDYKDIVKRAIDWRKDNIEKNYAGKVPV